MKKNVGNIDRIIRIVVGIVLILVGVFAEIGTTIAVIIFILGAISIITALLRTCPLYMLFKINTNK